MEYVKRLRQLRRAMGRAGYEALLVTHLPDIRYVSGFTGSHAVVAITPRRLVLFTDGRYSGQAREEVEAAGSGARIVIGKAALREACELLQGLGTASVQYDGEHVTVAELSRMQESLVGVSKAAARRFFEPATPFPVAGLREIKDEDELAHLEGAAQLGCRLFDAIVPHLEAGTPEREVAAELEFFARSLGADGMSFDTIVASGVRSSLPHGHATGLPLPRRGFVTLDFGVILSGYCSDMTRTVYMGRPTREEMDAYDAVLEAQETAVAAVKAGVLAGDVDEAARAVLRRAKLAEFFTHSTGHGVGMEIHEGPRLAAKQQQALAAGMVVTIEPGIYLPGRFGIRIEDMVVVTGDQGRVLTPSTKALLRL
ncbi:MAG TPA: Xaa-Pro peptidase family protein [Acidobacteriaceae bacterium]